MDGQGVGTPLDRPRALTPEVQATIVKLVAEGNYYESACRAAGITKQAILYWRKLYEAGVEHAQIYADFFTALERAQGIAETNAVAAVRTGRTGWQADAWFLERRFPSRWLMKRQVQKVEVKQGAAPPVVIIPDNGRDPTPGGAPTSVPG